MTVVLLGLTGLGVWGIVRAWREAKRYNVDYTMEES